jgi:hypothetical protein
VVLEIPVEWLPVHCEQAASLLEFHVPLTNCLVRRWFCVVHGPKPPLHSHNWLSFANSKTENAFLFPVHTMFHHDCRLAVKPASTLRRLVHKKTWRDSQPIDMLPFSVTIPATVPERSEVPEGHMNYPVFWFVNIVIKVVYHCSFCLYCGGEINFECFYTDMIGLFIS